MVNTKSLCIDFIDHLKANKNLKSFSIVQLTNMPLPSVKHPLPKIQFNGEANTPRIYSHCAYHKHTRL